MRSEGGVGAEEWQGRTGESWAAEWRRTDRSFGMLTEQLLQRSRTFACESVLDVGCGAGELSLAIARGRPQCRVVGLDISPQLIAAALGRAAHLENVSFALNDAATWRPEDSFAPDLIVSRHGVMFFDEPVAAFAHLRGIAASGAGLLFSCFRARDQNAVFTEPARLLPGEQPPPDPDAPGPFAFADRGKIETILGDAGWTGIAIEPYDFAMIVGAGPDPVEDTVAYFRRIGALARAASELGDSEREQVLDGIRQLARNHLREGIVALRAAAWIVSARAT